MKQSKITYDDTRDISIRCVDKMMQLKIFSSYPFEIQDLIQDEINNVLELNIDNDFEITIKKKSAVEQVSDFCTDEEGNNIII